MEHLPQQCGFLCYGSPQELCILHHPAAL